VPRAEFVDAALARYAGRDAPLPIGEGQTISQPFVVALMTQALALAPGERVLEVGTGSGYQTAILCEVTARPGLMLGENMWTVERQPTLAAGAAAVLRRLGYTPHLRVGDGAAGWPEGAPYDAIIVSAAPYAVPRPLWDQLGDGGRLVIPIGEPRGEQWLWLILREGDQRSAQSLGPVRFVPLISPLLDDVENCIFVGRGRP
jgi:protein-L-isoaspartate(D-aspartate) O-methyltransferase